MSVLCYVSHDRLNGNLQAGFSRHSTYVELTAIWTIEFSSQ